ncbi:MAG: AMP-binding protein [Candidatus Hadarchaeales archaeon]
MITDSFSRYRQKYPGGNRRNNTWGGRLQMLAHVIPDRTSFIQGERELTWKQFNERVNRLANAFLDLGIKKEDRIAIVGFNCIEWMETYFAASKIGAVPVNVNTRFVLDEVRYILENSDSTAVVLESESLEIVKKACEGLPSLKHSIVWGGDSSGEMLSYEGLLKEHPPTEPELEWEVTNEDFCFLFYTGGTTGYPKGTVWDYENRVKGLDMLLYHSMAHIINRLAYLPKDSFTGTINALLPPESTDLVLPFFQEPPQFESLFELIKTLYPPGFEPEAKDLTQSLLELQRSMSESVRQKMVQLISTPPEERGTKQEIFRDPAVVSLLRENMRILMGTPLAYLLNGSMTKILPAAPLFHGAAYECNFALLGASGATSVYLTSRHFDPKELWETVEKRRVNYILIVGDAFAIPMAEELERRKYDLSSVTNIVSSGVTWSPEIKRRILKHLPRGLLLDALGTTEVSAAQPFISTPSDEEIPKLKIKISPDGVYPCRVINPETGRDAKPGERGELIHGGYMALGYWKDPERTAKYFRWIDGRRWFFVGDEGIVDEDGYFHFIGRGATVINTGGEKVYPEEVEETIKTHPKVRDAVVIGVPDKRWGEAVTALVELKAGERANAEEIIEFCRGRLAGYKKPKHVIFLEKIPRSASGKIERGEIKEMAKKILKLESS